MDAPYSPIRWNDDHIAILDQRLLPQQVVHLKCVTANQVAEAIRTLAVRGAPLIGIAAAMGLALHAKKLFKKNLSLQDFREDLLSMAATLEATRPTAVNLRWALDRLRRKISAAFTTEDLIQEALNILTEQRQWDLAMAEHAQRFIQPSDGCLTICNTGALATGGFGTALGALIYAHRRGKKISVYTCETRPLLQGARLTTWELAQWHMDYTLMTDSMAASLMSQGKIHSVWTGADRIAANGDTANKIGTYGLAIAAKHHGIPFYVVAPSSTIDFHIADRSGIPIENRSEKEVLEIRGIPLTPENTNVWNPAFDITPAELITAIITENGIASPATLKNATPEN